MKKNKVIALLALALVIVFLLIFSQDRRVCSLDTLIAKDILTTSSFNQTPLNLPDGITMTINLIEENSIEYSITNHSDNAVFFGDDFQLEVQDSNEWYTIPLKNNRYFYVPRHQLNPKATYRSTLDLSIFEYNCSGDYRLILQTDDSADALAGYEIVGHFTI